MCFGVLIRRLVMKALEVDTWEVDTWKRFGDIPLFTVFTDKDKGRLAVKIGCTQGIFLFGVDRRVCPLEASEWVRIVKVADLDDKKQQNNRLLDLLAKAESEKPKKPDLCLEGAYRAGYEHGKEVTREKPDNTGCRDFEKQSIEAMAEIVKKVHGKNLIL